MKKIVGFILVIILLISGCIGCGQKEKNVEEIELHVFAAASLTETLTALGNQYMEEHTNIKLIFTFDSSGTLKTQIQEGATCDVFISAGQKQMDELENVMQGTRFDILENKVALVVPAGNEAKITSYEELKEQLENKSIVMAMGNEDVPIGQYTQKILDYYGFAEEELAKAGCITYGTNVKEVTTQVAEAMVDCGIVYATDAFSANLKVVDVATAQMCGQVVYPAAVIDNSEYPEEASTFLEYLKGENASAVFEKVGFTPVK